MQGFDYDTVIFKQAINMFEIMHIVKTNMKELWIVSANVLNRVP